jgi:4-hydroxy-3-polyprenylbenzoate decarboxylase
MGIDATRKLPSEGYDRGWPELVRMDEKVRAKIDALALRLGLG